MTDKATIKKRIDIEKFLVRQKWEVAKKIKSWKERNEKYFKDWDSVKAIRVLREKNGRP